MNTCVSLPLIWIGKRHCQMPSVMTRRWNGKLCGGKQRTRVLTVGRFLQTASNVSLCPVRHINGYQLLVDVGVYDLQWLSDDRSYSRRWSGSLYVWSRQACSRSQHLLPLILRLVVGFVEGCIYQPSSSIKYSCFDLMIFILQPSLLDYRLTLSKDTTVAMCRMRVGVG